MVESKEKLGYNLIRLLAVLVILANMAAYYLPEEKAWGVWPYSTLPLPVGLALGLAAIGVVLWSPSRWLRFSIPKKVCAVAAVLSLPLFWIGRIRHTHWGDASLLLKAIPHPVFHLTYTWQAPFDVFIHAKLWALGHRLWGWPDPLPVYRIVSISVGVAFVYVVCRLALAWEEQTEYRVLLFLLISTLGTVELFFGYVENYPVAALGITLYLALSLRVLWGEIPVYWPATALAITMGFHPSTGILLPSLIYLGLLWARGKGIRGLLDAAFQIAAPMLVVGTGVLVLMTAGHHGLSYLFGVDRPGGGDARMFVPLRHVSTKWEHYTMFSVGHLIDIVNEQLLTAPVLLPTVLVLWALKPRSMFESEEAKFFGIAVAFYLLLIWTWNPDYGGRKDWDLFSLAAIPLAFLTWSTLKEFFSSRYKVKAGLALVAVQLIHTAAWVYQNAHPWPH